MRVRTCVTQVTRPSGAAAAGESVEPQSLAEAWAAWKADGETCWRQMADVTAMLEDVVAEDASNA